MAVIEKTVIMNLSSMKEEERFEWATRLRELHIRIFEDAESFDDYVINSEADESKLALFMDGDSLVGYCTAHRFMRELNGRTIAIFRAEAGLLRNYRGSNATFSFGFKEALNYKLLHPLQESYYLGTFVHPSIYRLMTKYFPIVYPNCHDLTPPHVKQLMMDLVNLYKAPAVNPENPFIRKVGWVTADSEEERRHWQENDHPDVRYFITENPGYGEGHGLVTLIPIDMTNLTGVFLRLFAFKVGAGETGKAPFFNN